VSPNGHGVLLAVGVSVDGLVECVIVAVLNDQSVVSVNESIDLALVSDGNSLNLQILRIGSNMLVTDGEQRSIVQVSQLFAEVLNSVCVSNCILQLVQLLQSSNTQDGVLEVLSVLVVRVTL
jgi:hypothetical protein